jgi:hypothetical protein
MKTVPATSPISTTPVSNIPGPCGAEEGLGIDLRQLLKKEGTKVGSVRNVEGEKKVVSIHSL